MGPKTNTECPKSQIIMWKLCIINITKIVHPQNLGNLIKNHMFVFREDINSRSDRDRKPRAPYLMAKGHEPDQRDNGYRILI